MSDIKELKEFFEGRGEVSGYTFRLLDKTPYAFLYEVCDTATMLKHYEVFEHTVNEKYGCISYPRSTSFGKWAWCTRFEDDARLRFARVSANVENRIHNRSIVPMYNNK